MFQNAFGHYVHVECGLITVVTDEASGSQQSVGAPVPLKSVDILANIVHSTAQVELTQVFVNKETHPIEAIYYFPIDSSAGVTHFWAEVEGRIINGTVKPKEEAKAQYDEAISKNQTAFLTESNKPDIFKIRIGFLTPGTEVKVVIGYVTEVKNEKGSYAQRFFIPTTIAPRYMPPLDMDTLTEELKEMTFTKESPAPLSITVKVAVDGGMRSIVSPTHQVTVPLNDLATGRATVTLTGQTTDMDRDFVLLITPLEVHQPRLYIEEQATSTALMAQLIPTFTLKDQKVESIFILDRSGSMSGASIEMAKKALALFLASLPDDCYFNIVGFGSSFQFLFPNSVELNNANLKTARAHAKALRADLGGTELLQPLKAVFAKPPVRGYLRQIFILTDGEISNTEEVLGLTKANAHLGRVFSLGIGAACSHYLVEGLAEAGGGTSSFVTYNESIDAKILQQLKNAIQPSLTDVQMEWMDIPEHKSPKKTITQVPEKIPPIYDGTQLQVFGIFDFDWMPTGAKITAQSPDGPLSVEMKFDDGHKLGSTEVLHKLATVKLLRELELKISGDEASPNVEELKKEIIAISCDKGIVSKYTSILAIDLESNSPADQNWVIQTRHVSSQLAHGWNTGLGLSASSASGAKRGARPSRSVRGYSQNIKCRGSAGSTGRGWIDSSKIRRRGMSKRGNRSVTQTDGSSAAKRRRRSAGASMASGSRPRRGSSTASRASGSTRSRRGSSRVSRVESEPTGLTLSTGIPVPAPAPAVLSKDATPRERLLALIDTQDFNGSFLLDENFANSIGMELKDLKNEAQRLGVDEIAFATALALEFLARKLTGLKDSWELISGKAEKWMTKNFSNTFAAIRAEAQKLVV